MANRVKLTIKDIKPLEAIIEKYASMGSGLVWYKGEGWDHRMARIALDDLKIIRRIHEREKSRARRAEKSSTRLQKKRGA